MIKKELLTSVKAYNPLQGGAIEAPIRDKFVPALFSSKVFERRTLAGKATALVRRLTRVDNEDKRWKLIFKEAVEELSSDEIAQFTGERGGAFYRFRASLQNEAPVSSSLVPARNPVLRSSQGDRRETLKLSRLDQIPDSEENPELLLEIVEGKGKGTPPKALLERVLKVYQNESLEKAIPLEEQAQELIASKDRQGLQEYCAKLATSFKEGLLLFGKIPSVAPRFNFSSNVMGKQGVLAADFLKDEASAKAVIEKITKGASKGLKKTLLESGLLPKIREGLLVKEEMFALSLDQDISWWKRLASSPKAFVGDKIKQIAGQYVDNSLSSVDAMVTPYLDPDQQLEWKQIIEDDAGFAEALNDLMQRRIGKVVLPLREKMIEGIQEVSESLPPFMNQSMKVFGLGQLGRKEQPFWLEIVPNENGKFTVKLFLAGRGVLDHHVEGNSYQSVFCFEDIEAEKISTDFFYRFYAYQAFAEWDGEIYDTHDVIDGLTDLLEKPPNVGKQGLSSTAHLSSGQWGLLQEYGLKSEEDVSFKLKFEAYCELFKQSQGGKWDTLLQEKGQALIDEAIFIEQMGMITEEELKVYFATLQDALWRLEKEEKSIEEMPDVIPQELQALASQLFSMIGVTPFRVGLVKDLLIDQLGEESRETVDSLCSLVEKEVGLLEPTPKLETFSQMMEVRFTAFSVARVALRIFITPFAFVAELTISVAFRTFNHCFPQVGNQIYRLKIRLVARAVLPFLLSEKQMVGFRALLSRVEQQLLQTQELSFEVSGPKSTLETLKVSARVTPLSASNLTPKRYFSPLGDLKEKEPLTPQNITSRLKSWQAEALCLVSRNQIAYLNEKLKQLPPVGDSFWDEVNDLEECLVALTEASFMMYKSDKGSLELRNQCNVHQFTLYALVDKLAKKHPKSCLKGFNLNPWSFVLWHQKPTGRLLDSQMEKKYEQACRYFSIDPSKTYSMGEIQERSQKGLFAHAEESSDARQIITSKFFTNSPDGAYLKRVLATPTAQKRLREVGIEADAPLLDQLTMLYVNQTRPAQEDPKEKFLEVSRQFNALVRETKNSSMASEDDVKGILKLLHEGDHYLEENREAILEGMERDLAERYTGILPLCDHLVRQVHEFSNQMLLEETRISNTQTIFDSTIQFLGRKHIVHRKLNSVFSFFTGRNLFNPVIDTQSSFSDSWGSERKVSRKISNSATNSTCHNLHFMVTGETNWETKKETIETSYKLALRAQHLVINDGGYSQYDKTLRMISIDPVDRPIRALAYFTEEPHELKKNGIPLLEISLLQGSDLRNQLRTHPEFFKTLQKFFATQFTYLLENGNFEKAFDFLRLAILVQLELETMEGFDEPLMDFEAGFEKMERFTSEEQIANVAVLKVLRHALKNPVELSEEEQQRVARELSKARTTVKALGCFIQGENLGQLFSETYIRWLPHIEKVCEEEAFLEEISTRFCELKGLDSSSGEEVKWEGRYPSFQKGQLQVNLETGEVNVDKEAWGKKIRAALIPILPKAADAKMVREEGGVFTIPDLSIEVETDAIQGIASFYKVIQGKRFKWVEVAGKDSCVSYWLEEGGDQLLKFNGEAFVGRYRTKPGQELEEKSLDLIAELKEFKGEWLDKVSLTSLRGAMAPLAKFCSVDEMQGFTARDNPNQLRLIELTQMNLRFEVKEGKAHSLEYPGFYLAKKQKEKSFSTFGNYLVLESDTGAKKILLPKNTLSKGIFSRFLSLCGLHSSSELLNSFSFTLQQFKQEGYYEYDFDLTTSDPAAVAHLVTFYLAKQNFEEARKFLNRLEGMAGRTLTPLSQEVQEMCNQLSVAASQLGEPETTEMSLRMCALVEENRSRCSQNNKEKEESLYAILYNGALQKNYLEYLERKGGYSYLDPYQELFLIERLERSAKSLAGSYQKKTDSLVDLSSSVEAISSLFLHPVIGERSKELYRHHAPQLVAMQPLLKKMVQNFFSTNEETSNQATGFSKLLDIVNSFEALKLSQNEFIQSLENSSKEKLPLSELPAAFHLLTPEMIIQNYLSYYALAKNEYSGEPQGKEKLLQFKKALKLMKGYQGPFLPALEVMRMVVEKPGDFPKVADLQKEFQRGISSAVQTPAPPPKKQVKSGKQSSVIPVPKFSEAEKKEVERVKLERAKIEGKVNFIKNLRYQLAKIGKDSSNLLVKGNRFSTTLENFQALATELEERERQKLKKLVPPSVPKAKPTNILPELEPVTFFEAMTAYISPQVPTATSASTHKTLDAIFATCTSKQKRKQIWAPLKKIAETVGPSAALTIAQGSVSSYLGLNQLYRLWSVGKVGVNLASAYQKSVDTKTDFEVKKKAQDRAMPRWSQPLQEEDEQIGRTLKEAADRFFTSVEATASPNIQLESTHQVSDNYTTAVNESLDDFRKREKGKEWTGEANVDALYQLEAQISQANQNMSELLGEEKEALLTFINSDNRPVTDLNRESIYLAGERQKRERVNFETLLECYLYQDTDQLMSKTGLSADQVEQVYQRLTRYLVWETRSNQLKRLKGQIKEASEKPRGALERELLVRNIAEGLSANRAYKIDGASSRLTRAYLVFESKTGNMLWEKQVSQLEKMVLGKEEKAVVELIMGSGKTYFGIPMTDYFVADGSKLVINIFPRALAKTNIADIGKQAETIFFQDAYAMQFNRGQPLTPEALKGRLITFLRAIKEQGQINMCKEDLQALELIWLEEMYKKESSENLTLMTELLRLIRTHGKPNFDEVHDILRRDSQLNHPLGAKKYLERDYIRVTEEYVRALLTEEETIGLRSNQQAFMSDEAYETEVKPAVARKLAESKFLNQDDPESTASYLTSATKALASKTSRSLLGLARGLVRVLGPKSLTKIVNVHYGPSKVDEKGYAKPYRGNNNCVEEADIQSQYEACLKTYLQQMVNRMSSDQALQLIKRLHKQASKEKEVHGVNFEETKTARLFAKWCEGKYQLDKLLKRDLDALTKLLNKQDEAVLLHTRVFIAPQISYYPLSLSSNSQNFASMFPSFYSDTGTPTNHETYPIGTKVHFDEGTTGESIALLTSLCSSKESIVTLSSDTPEDSLNEIMQESVAPGKTKALIDCGAVWRGMGSSQVVKTVEKHLQERDTSIDSIVYYREDQLLVEKSMKSEKLEPFKKIKETEKGRFAYFDHSHTYGADIPLNETAEGLLTIGEDTTLTQLAQAMWRLRGLKRLKQSLRLVLTEKTKKLIAGDEECTLEKILQFVIRNEAKKMIEDNFSADKQKIADVIRRAVLDKLLETSNHKTMFGIFEEFNKVLLSRSEEDPYILFGLSQKDIAPEEVLDKMKNEYFGLVERSRLFTPEEKAMIEEELEKVGKGNYPQSVEVSINGDKHHIAINDTLGQEQQVNQDQENQLQQDVELDLDLVAEKKAPPASASNLLPGKKWDPTKDYSSSLNWLHSSAPLSDTLAGADLPQLAAHAASFAGKIRCSDNFIGRKKKYGFFETPCTPFTTKQKPIQEVLIVIKEGKHTLLLLDQEEAHFWRQQMAKSKLKMALYDVSLGATVASNNFTDEDFKIEGLSKDLVRLKFLKGSVRYSDEEIELLKPWIEECGPDKMENLFKEIHSRFGLAPLMGSRIESLFEEFQM